MALTKPAFTRSLCVTMALFVWQSLHLYASEERLRFAVSPMGIIDILTIVPPLITVSFNPLRSNVVNPLPHLHSDSQTANLWGSID